MGSQTLGDTSAPTGGFVNFANAENQFSLHSALTMTSAGIIDAIQVYARAFNTDLTAKVCLWNGSGTLLQTSAAFTIPADGVTTWRRATLSTVQVAAVNDTFLVGFFYSDFTEEVRIRLRTSGDWRGRVNHGSNPDNQTSYNLNPTSAGAMGAYLEYDPVVVRIRRSGAWVIANGPGVRRSSAWSPLQRAAVRRSSAWVDTT